MTNTDLDDYLASAAEDAPQASMDDLAVLEERGRVYINLDQRIDDLTAELKTLAERKKEMEQHELPALLRQIGQDKFKVDNNELVMTDKVFAAIPKGDLAARRAIFNWLVDNKHGGVIQREMTVILPKGDEVIAMRVVEAVQEVDPSLPVEVTEAVHSSTYSALCRTFVRDGIEVPRDLLKLTVMPVIEIADKPKRAVK